MNRLDYAETSPYRIEAFGKYYTKKLIWRTKAEAVRDVKCGDWVCSVTFLGKHLFFSTTGHSASWYKKGVVIGAWNELTLLERKP